MTAPVVANTKFDVLQDVPLAARLLLLVICALTCAWGIHNNAPLLILASKIGFPLVLVPCSVVDNRNRVLPLLYYTFTIIAVGLAYFTINPVTVDNDLLKLFVPNVVDFGLAIALGLALSYFWDHAIRLNIIVMGAAMAYMLPACVVTGYYLSIHNDLAWTSLAFHFSYAIGVFFGAWAHKIYVMTTEQ